MPRDETQAALQTRNELPRGAAAGAREAARHARAALLLGFLATPPQAACESPSGRVARLPGPRAPTRPAHTRSARATPPQAPPAPALTRLSQLPRARAHLASSLPSAASRQPRDAGTRNRTAPPLHPKATPAAGGAPARRTREVCPKSFLPRFSFLARARRMWDRLRGCAGKVTHAHFCTSPLSGVLRHPE